MNADPPRRNAKSEDIAIGSETYVQRAVRGTPTLKSDCGLTQQ
jgi:hypothetical protein